MPKPWIVTNGTQARGHIGLKPNTAVDKTGHKWMRLQLVQEPRQLNLKHAKNKKFRRCANGPHRVKVTVVATKAIEIQRVTIFWYLQPWSLFFVCVFLSQLSPFLSYSDLCYVKTMNKVASLSYWWHSFEHRAATCVTTWKIKFCMEEAWEHNIHS